jgi:hypothetical protein
MFEGKRFSKQLVLSTMVSVFGVVLAIMNNPEFHWVGFLCAAFSTILSVAQAVGSGILLQKANLSVLIVALVTSLPAIMSLLPLFISLELDDSMCPILFLFSLPFFLL